MGKLLEERLFDQSMDERIAMIPEDIQRGIFEGLAKSHKENLALLKNPADFEKEKFEVGYFLIQGWLPKEAGSKRLWPKLQELYPLTELIRK